MGKARLTTILIVVRQVQTHSKLRTALRIVFMLAAIFIVAGLPATLYGVAHTYIQHMYSLHFRCILSRMHAA